MSYIKKPYHIIEEPNFEQKLDNLRRVFPRIDDIWIGISFIIARNPFLYDCIDNFPNFRIAQSFTIGNIPAFWLIFQIDETSHTLVFISIELVKSNEE